MKHQKRILTLTVAAIMAVLLLSITGIAFAQTTYTWNFTIHDSNGNPVQGVSLTLFYIATGGSDVILYGPSSASDANGHVSFTTNDVYAIATANGVVPNVFIAGNGPNGWSGYTQAPTIGGGSSYISGNTITMPFNYVGSGSYIFVSPSPSPTSTPHQNPTPAPTYNPNPTPTPTPAPTYNPYPTPTASPIYILGYGFSSRDLLIIILASAVIFGCAVYVSWSYTKGTQGKSRKRK